MSSFRNLRFLSVSRHLDIPSLMVLSTTLTKLERFYLQDSHIIAQDCVALEAVQFLKVKSFTYFNTVTTELKAATAYFIERCLPSLRHLYMSAFSEFSHRPLYCTNKLIPPTCLSLVGDQYIFYIRPTSSLKCIQNICVKLTADDYPNEFADHLKFFLSLKVVNVRLFLRQFDFRFVARFVEKIMKTVPELEVMSIRLSDEDPEQFRNSELFPAWKEEFDNTYKDRVLKLLIIGDSFIIQKPTVTVSDLRFIDDLDYFYGFFIRRSHLQREAYLTPWCQQRP